MDDRNIFNTIYYPAEVLVYFEKHHIFNIFIDLMVLIDRVRPRNLREFIAKNIVKVAQNYNRKIAFILAPPLFNYNKFAKEYTNIYGAPVIKYTKKRKPNDTEEIIKKLKKFLKHNHLEDKHLITINFPINRDEILNFTKENLSPSCIYEIKPGFQTPFKTQEQHADEKRNYLAYFKEVKNFYKNIYAEINYGANNENINEIEKKEYLNYNFVTFSHHLHNSLRHNFPQDKFGDQGIKTVICQRNSTNFFRLRVIIYGRIGSGRTTQAAILSYRFGLILISVEQLIEEYRNSECPIGDAVRHSKDDNNFSDVLLVTILQKRVLQPDCILYGWVVYDFPYNRAQMEIIYNHFLKPPNKIIFLHVSESMCRQRLKIILTNYKLGLSAKRSYKFKIEDDNAVLINPKEAENYIDAHLKLFNLNCRDIYDFCKTKKEIININGNYPANRVKTAIWSRVEQDQKLLKNNFNKKSTLNKDNYNESLSNCNYNMYMCNDD